MNPCSTTALLKTVGKRILRVPFCRLPEGSLKFKMRAVMAKYLRGIPNEFLVNPGDTVVLVGTHRIDTVMLWSCLVGGRGKVLVIEAVPDYVENIRRNLQHHLNWPLNNVTYVVKGVDSAKGRKSIQIGERADYNKLANQEIDDGLSDEDYVREVEIDIDTIDNILLENGIRRVDHLHMTISGMEVEALKGMPQTLKMAGIRMVIRSLHKKNEEPLYVQVTKMLEEAGFATVLARGSAKFAGRDIFGSKV
jgi:FkbM family methyltransferase